MTSDSIINKINDSDIDFYEALNLMADNQIKVKKRKSIRRRHKNIALPFY